MTTYPSTSVLDSDGTGTSVLTPPSGFGEAFGQAFGGWVTTVAAVLDAGTALTAVLANDGTSSAVIADPGASAALVTEVIVLAELQLV